MICVTKKEICLKASLSPPYKNGLDECVGRLQRRLHIRESGKFFLEESGRFCLWNPESWVLESGIQLKESEILLTIGIQNPSSTDKYWNPVPGIRNAWDETLEQAFSEIPKWEAIDEKMIHSSHANRTHFHKKGFVPNLVLKGKLSGVARKWSNSSVTSKGKSILSSWHRGELCFSPLPLPPLGFCYSVPFGPQMGSTR